MMTLVVILVPHGSVLAGSVLGLFKVFHLANQRSIEAGRGLAFDVHLVGATARTDLYGGQLLVSPDLRLEDVIAAELAIVPAMAGDIASAIHNNAAFVPWLKNQYHAGCAIAGLCTGGLFIVETGLLNDEDCSCHWFVDDTFRKQYSQINGMAERTVRADDSIQSDGGAWSFLHQVVEDSVDREAALSCSERFQDAFNRECQSLVAVYDRRQHARQSVCRKTASGVSAGEMTAERFALLFEPKGGRRGGANIADLLEESLRMPTGRCELQTAEPWSQGEGRSRGNDHNASTFKGLFRKIELADRSPSHG